MTAHSSFFKMPSPPKVISRTLVCLLAATMLLPWANSAAPAKDDWLPIPPEDLALKDNPKSPGAHAMILYRESSVDAQLSSNDEYFQIKIFTQEGVKEEADVEIPFVKGVEDIRDVRARTVHPDGTIVNFEGKPFEKTVEKVSGFKFLAKTFTLPDVQPGSIIEYKYRSQSDSSFYFNQTWVVQGSLYTRLAKFSIKPDPSEHAPLLAFRYSHLPSGLKPEKQAKGYYALEIHDLPGIEDESYMPPERSLKGRVEFYYPDRNTPEHETVQQYWERTGKSWSEVVDNYLNKKSALQAEVARVVSPGDPPETQLRKLYERAREIRNLSFEESKTTKEAKHENLKPNDTVEDVIKRGYGNSRQINYLLVGLFRAAGFDSNEIFLVPRNENFFLANSQDSSQLRANVVWVRSGTQEYYLDPGARYFPFGSLPWYETSASGIRVNKQGAVAVTTPFPPSSDTIIARHADLSIAEDGALAGTIEVDFGGQSGALWRKDIREADEAGRNKILESDVKRWLPSDCSFELKKVSGLDDILVPLHVEGKVKSMGYGTTAGRRILLPVEFFQATQARAFEREKRTNDVYFHFPYEELDDVKLHVPPGYKIETFPPAQNVDLGAVKYQISAATQGDALEIKRHVVVNIFMVPVIKYPALRSFFGTVKKNDDAEVVLQNAGPSKSN
jgi:Domain of Unknown Function with PDB structure (DUF3857)